MNKSLTPRDKQNVSMDFSRKVLFPPGVGASSYCQHLIVNGTHSQRDPHKFYGDSH